MPQQEQRPALREWAGWQGGSPRRTRRRGSDNEKSPLADTALDASAKAAKAKLQAALKQFEGPRPEFFVKQTQSFGGEAGEDANGVKKAKGKRNKKAQ